MPSVSKKQHNFMEAVAHSPEFAKKAGIKQSVGKDFAAADKGKTFKAGGIPPSINKQKTHHGAIQMPNFNLNKYIGHKDGGITKGTSMKKLFGGKETYGEELKEATSLKSDKVSPAGFVKGEKSEGHKDKEENPSLIAKEIKSGAMSPKQYASVESKEPKKMARGGFVRSADGIATKGKTKGRII